MIETILFMVVTLIAVTLVYMYVDIITKYKYRKKHYLEHEIVRYYSLCTGNLTKALIYNTLDESETFENIKAGEDNNQSVMKNLLLIADELKKKTDYKKELDAITEEKLQAIALTEKMFLEKGIRFRHWRKKVDTNFRWNYWSL